MRFFFSFAFLAGFASAASAIVNVFDPQGNTVAPTGMGGEPGDPGFSHVGQVNGSTGVYLGNRWVLTANHVGAGNFSLGGNVYNPNGVDSHQIGGTDLRLFRLSTSPGLPLLRIASASPAVNDFVVMIGAGRTPNATTTNWFVDTDPATWVWSETNFPEADATAEGYETTNAKAVRWGTNTVAGFSTVSSSDAFFTTFTQGAGATTYEAQAVTNDSGSGVFYDDGAGWALAGTIVTVGTFNNQPPGDPNTDRSALFGNTTFSIDLADHADEINGFVVPEPATYGLGVGIIAFASILGRRRRQASEP